MNKILLLTALSMLGTSCSMRPSEGVRKKHKVSYEVLLGNGERATLFESQLTELKEISAADFLIPKEGVLVLPGLTKIGLELIKNNFHLFIKGPDSMQSFIKLCSNWSFQELVRAAAYLKMKDLLDGSFAFVERYLLALYSKSPVDLVAFLNLPFDGYTFSSKGPVDDVLRKALKEKNQVVAALLIARGADASSSKEDLLNEVRGEEPFLKTLASSLLGVSKVEDER